MARSLTHLFVDPGTYQPLRFLTCKCYNAATWALVDTQDTNSSGVVTFTGLSETVQYAVVPMKRGIPIWDERTVQSLYNISYSTYSLKTAASGARMEIDGSGVRGYDATTQRYNISNDGSLWLGSASGAGVQISTAGAPTVTITGGTFTLKSATSGARIEITSAGLGLYTASAQTVSLASADGTFTIQSAETGARMTLTNSGLDGYDATTQRLHIANDGSAWFGTLAGDGLQLAATGTVTLTLTGGTFSLKTAASSTRLEMTSAGIKGYNLTNQRLNIGTDGSCWFGSAASAGLQISTAGTPTLTITGGTFTLKTAASGARVELTSAGMKTYDASGNNVIVDGTGVTIIKTASYDDALRFYDGATYTGTIKSSTALFQIYSTNGGTLNKPYITLDVTNNELTLGLTGSTAILNCRTTEIRCYKKIVEDATVSRSGVHAGGMYLNGTTVDRDIGHFHDFPEELSAAPSSVTLTNVTGIAPTVSVKYAAGIWGTKSVVAQTHESCIFTMAY